MFSIDIHALKQLPRDQLQTEVKKLTAHINAGKTLAHQGKKANEYSLLALDGSREGTPSVGVIADLNTIILISNENGLDESLRNELETIRNFRDQILVASAIENKPVPEFTADPLRKILSHLSLVEAGFIRSVAISWDQMAAETQINAINAGRLPLKHILKGMNAKQSVDWLINNPAHKFLEYADFLHLKDFDNTCLQKLAENFPNLKHLLIPFCAIHGDALKHLQKIPLLQTLNIAGCEQLEANALKHLANTPELQILKISYCRQLGADALKYLANTPKLLHLEIGGCNLLESDMLKHLSGTPLLQKLDITGGCDYLESDALKHLEKTPILQSLILVLCMGLEEDALKHLEIAPKLEYLNIAWCAHLDIDKLPAKLSFLLKKR